MAAVKFAAAMHSLIYQPHRLLACLLAYLLTEFSSVAIAFVTLWHLQVFQLNKVWCRL